VLLVPAEAAWLVPVVLQFGAFNGCFEPPYHSAAIRYWQRRYGADLFAMDRTWLEFIVARPPVTREGAMELAAGLLERHIWWAWWD
jgi:hypothetical protein